MVKKQRNLEVKMPTTVEDLVWYIMCFTITTGIPTIIIIALNIQKLLHDVVIKQALQAKWIEDHDKSSMSAFQELWAAISELRTKYEVFDGLWKREEKER